MSNIYIYIYIYIYNIYKKLNFSQFEREKINNTTTN